MASFATLWVRRCDECDHWQIAKKPDQTKDLSNSYCLSKCRVCKSEALDYGQEVTEADWIFFKQNGTWPVRKEEE
jgi:hypothetical protein